MSTSALLRELTERGIVLRVDGDGIHYDAPAGALTDDLRGQLIESKPNLLPLLRVQAFRAEIHAAVARLSAGYTYSASEISEAIVKAHEADAALDRVAEHVEEDLHGALVALRSWEAVWAAAGVLRSDRCSEGGLDGEGSNPSCAEAPHGQWNQTVYGYRGR